MPSGKHLKCPAASVSFRSGPHRHVSLHACTVHALSEGRLLGLPDCACGLRAPESALSTHSKVSELLHRRMRCTTGS